MTDEETVAQILLGEAAGEGPEGMGFVRDIMFNRALKAGKSLYDIATAPKQFSAYARPDLAEFASKQPWELQQLAQMMVREAMDPSYEPTHPDIRHYVTSDFYAKRDKLPASHWVRKMKPMKTVGRHVALSE